MFPFSDAVTIPTAYAFACRAIHEFHQDTRLRRNRGSMDREQLVARIGKRQAVQAAMKAINAASRMKSEAAGRARLRALGLDESMVILARRYGYIYEAWELDSIGQTIRRLRKRLA